MNIALDATYSIDRKPSGVGVYCSRIIQELAETGSPHHFHLGYRFRRFFPALCSKLPASNCSRFLLEESEPWLSPRRADLFHGLNQRLPGIQFRRMITTFHDLFMLTAEYSTPEFRERFTTLSRSAAERSDHIIAVSQFTADQVVELLGYPRDRITVVHHGVDRIPGMRSSKSEYLEKRFGVTGPFLLHVGAIQRRKNIERLVAAFEQLDPRFSLVLAGTAGFGSQAILSRITASPARERIFVTGYVSRRDLYGLYRAASLLAFPSLDEGFGIPIVEAMSVGLPVVTSDRGAMREVAGNGGILVDPESTDSIHDGLVSALTDQLRCERLGALAKLRAAQFTWQRAAERTLDVYRKLAASG